MYAHNEAWRNEPTATIFTMHTYYVSGRLCNESTCGSQVNLPVLLLFSPLCVGQSVCGSVSLLWVYQSIVGLSVCLWVYQYIVGLSVCLWVYQSIVGLSVCLWPVGLSVYCGFISILWVYQFVCGFISLLWVYQCVCGFISLF